jgi:ribosome biogenesis GTPase
MSRPTDKPPRKNWQTHQFMEEADDESPRRQYSGERGRQEATRRFKRTAQLRSEGPVADDLDTLPIGQVVQIFSLYSRVSHPTGPRLCVMRKTLTKLSRTNLVVGDQVRFRDDAKLAADLPAAIVGLAPAEPAVIEQILPRRTFLTRTSAHGDQEQPIVANADQMLIVAAIKEPRVKWGLIDRMIVAARRGGLEPIVCLNKIDLADGATVPELDHYASMGIRVCRTSVEKGVGLDELRDLLRDKATVLAGHSGVGKSSLIGAVQPGLDIRVGRVSTVTEKGRHTTSSACRYDLDHGGCVIDTPGVKLFGLIGMKRDDLLDYFPDVRAETAPPWRMESYQRIAESLPG